MSVNRVSVTGHATRDAELRATPSGTHVLTFGVAVNERYFDQNSNKYADRPNFFDCVLFGNRAEALMPMVTKGVKVALDGKLRYSAWEKDGQKRSKVEIVVEEIDFMTYRGANESRSEPLQQPPAYQVPQHAQTTAVLPDSAAYDVDIPF